MMSYISVLRAKTTNTEKNNDTKEICIMNDTLMKKDNLSEDEEIKLKRLKEEIDNAYINMAKGAFIRSRAKWLELGERNSSYFFALEKRNQKRNNISALKIDDNIITNHLDISKYVGSFYSNTYKSNSNINDCDRFIESVKNFTPTISEHFKTNCERPITKPEISEAIQSMKKGKSPGNDGLGRILFTFLGYHCRSFIGIT